MTEAVAWLYKKKDGTQVITNDPDYADGTWIPLYTAPPKKEWVGLTDEEYEAMAEDHVTDCYFDTLEYAKAIEAKLKEKNK